MSIGLMSLDRVLLLTGHTDPEFIGNTFKDGVKLKFKRVQYIPTKYSPFWSKGRGYWFDLDLLEDHLESFDLSDFRKGMNIYLSDSNLAGVEGPILLLVNEDMHLSVALAPRTDGGVKE